MRPECHFSSSRVAVNSPLGFAAHRVGAGKGVSSSRVFSLDSQKALPDARVTEGAQGEGEEDSVEKLAMGEGRVEGAREGRQRGDRLLGTSVTMVTGIGGGEWKKTSVVGASSGRREPRQGEGSI